VYYDEAAEIPEEKITYQDSDGSTYPVALGQKQIQTEKET
jgi:hypothetical protein